MSLNFPRHILTLPILDDSALLENPLPLPIALLYVVHLFRLVLLGVLRELCPPEIHLPSRTLRFDSAGRRFETP